MTYNDNVICSLGPLLWWSVWSSLPIRALVALYHPGTLLYAAREAPLSSYQQEEMCSLQLSKGKSSRKWAVHLSSHRVTISITKMTHLHNCPKVMRFPSGFLHRWAADRLNPSTEVPRQRKEPSNAKHPAALIVLWMFLLLSGSIPNDQKLFLYMFSKNQRSPEWVLKDIF